MALRTGYDTGAYSAGKYGYPQVWEAQATATPSASATAVGKYFIGGLEVDYRLRTGYGTSVYGTNQYGDPDLWRVPVAVSVTSVVAQADGQRIHLSGAADTSTATPAAVAQRIQQPAASDSSAVSIVANGYFSAVGAATATITASMTDSYVRIRPFSASESLTSELSQRDARYKWIPVTQPTDTWTEASYRGD